MLFDNSELTPAGFLREYWQKEPLLLRTAFPDFEPQLDPDDIAGLACDEHAESRLIAGSFAEGSWTLRHGPFDEGDFAALPARDWTLLVQDVEKHYPPLRRLLARFDFLPDWRIDDLMVSVAGPGGSVGPHVDQYDVFLLQAAGRRRWQIARSFDPALLPGCELNVLRRFEPELEWDLQPGDVLYLPPGVAHHGIALEPRRGPSRHRTGAGHDLVHRHAGAQRG
jgi:50S ribosomal protein L16 3-hydroxylase